MMNAINRSNLDEAIRMLKVTERGLADDKKTHLSRQFKAAIDAQMSVISAARGVLETVL